MARKPAKKNPPWVTEALASSFEDLEDKIPARWLPKLEGVHASGRGQAIAAKMIEYGCGGYGCVLPTIDPKVVLKVTTDTTEAQFASELSETLVAPVCVTYFMVVRLSERHQGVHIHLLFREAAEHVGKIGKVLGRGAETLIDEQHEIAQEAYSHLFQGNYRDAKPALDKYEAAWMMMADHSKYRPLAALAKGIVQVFREQKIFFGDLHSGNFGQVTRDGNKLWVISDPGNVAVLP